MVRFKIVSADAIVSVKLATGLGHLLSVPDVLLRTVI